MIVLESELIGAAFTLALGFFMHFFYRLSGKDRIIGIIAPKNSSGFENLKLIFFPQIIYALPQYVFIGKNYQSFFTAKVFGITAGIAADLVIFFIVKANTVTHSAAFDILGFFLGTFSASIFSFKFVETLLSFNTAAAVLLIILLILFFVFTKHPLNTVLFRAPKKRIKADLGENCIKLYKYN